MFAPIRYAHLAIALFVGGCLSGPTGTDSTTSSAQQRVSCGQARSEIDAFLKREVPSGKSGTVADLLGAASSDGLIEDEFPFAERGSWAKRSLLVRWFSRGRVEYHPEYANDPATRAYVVLLGRVGAEALAALNGGDEHLKQVGSEAMRESYAGDALYHCVTDVDRYSQAFTGPPERLASYFGFAIFNDFESTWRGEGIPIETEAKNRTGGAKFSFVENLMRWGYPMSPFCELRNAGSDVSGVQYFERARLDRMRDGSVRVFEMGAASHEPSPDKSCKDSAPIATSPPTNAPLTPPQTAPEPPTSAPLPALAPSDAYYVVSCRLQRVFTNPGGVLIAHQRICKKAFPNCVSEKDPSKQRDQTAMEPMIGMGFQLVDDPKVSDDLSRLVPFGGAIQPSELGPESDVLNQRCAITTDLTRLVRVVCRGEQDSSTGECE